MNNLIYSPDAASYAVDDASNRLTINYGIGGFHSRNLINANKLVNVGWNCAANIYEYLAQAYRSFVASGGVSFLCDLEIDETFTLPNECKFIPGSFKLNSVEGETYNVVAQLSVKPAKYDVINKSWISDTGLQRIVMSVGKGTYVLTGRPVDFHLSHIHAQMPTGVYHLTGRSANLAKVLAPQALQTGVYILTGYPAELNKARIAVLDTGVYLITGHDADLTYNSGVTDPDFAFVGLLLPADALITVIGTNFNQDFSSVARTVQASNAGTGVDTGDFVFGAGSAKMSSAAAGGFKFTTSAGGSVPIAPRTGDFTIEFWIKVASGSMSDASAFSGIIQMGATRPFYFARAPIGSSPYNQLYVQVPGGITGDLTGSHITAFTPDVWHYVSWTRNTAISYFHFDGTLTDTFADLNDYGDNADTVNVYPSLGSNEEYKIDDFRMTMLARYTSSNYTVPAAAHPTS